MDQGVNRYGRRARPSLAEEQARMEARQRHADGQFNDLWRTLPASDRPRSAEACEVTELRRGAPQLPEENLLYFLEKFSPRLRGWEREILRIVRNIAQYFFPQRQTKVMNEGCATYVHYKIMNRLHEKGQITDGAMLEFLASHTAVVFQPDFDDRRYSGINPYALGFEMMCDIERIATQPTAEDRQYFPELAGCGDGLGALKDAWANYRDPSSSART
jgi:spore cortex formation protein SpoVR/YcgB (stage V sporulation)